MRIFPSQEPQFLDPSSPSVNYGNRKPFHVRTLKLLCLSEWLDLISNCKFIKKLRRWYQSVSLFYYKVQHVFQCGTIRISDVNNELITRLPRCPSLPFQGDWKKCTMRIYIRFLELSEFRKRQKLVKYISHMHFMISIISKFVKVFSFIFYYYTKQVTILSFKCQRRYQAVVTQSAPTILWDIFEKSLGLKRGCVKYYVLYFLACLLFLFQLPLIVTLLTVGFCWIVRVKRTRSKTKGAFQTQALAS